MTQVKSLSLPLSFNYGVTFWERYIQSTDKELDLEQDIKKKLRNHPRKKQKATEKRHSKKVKSSTSVQTKHQNYSNLPLPQAEKSVPEQIDDEFTDTRLCRQPAPRQQLGKTLLNRDASNYNCTLKILILTLGMVVPYTISKLGSEI